MSSEPHDFIDVTDQYSAPSGGHDTPHQPIVKGGGYADVTQQYAEDAKTDASSSAGHAEEKPSPKWSDIPDRIIPRFGEELISSINTATSAFDPTLSTAIMGPMGKVAMGVYGALTSPVSALGGAVAEPISVPAGRAVESAIGGRVGQVLGGLTQGAVELPTTFMAGSGPVKALGKGLKSALAKDMGETFIPKPSDAAKRLLAKDVELAPEQLGTPFTKSIAEKATSVPGLGEAIHARQRSTLESWNRATADEVLAPIGTKIDKDVKAGNDLINHVYDKLDDAYADAHKGLSFSPDPILENGQNAAMSRASNLLGKDSNALSTLKGTVDEYVTKKLYDSKTHTTPGYYDQKKMAFVPSETKTVLVPKELSGKELQSVRSSIRNEARGLRKSADMHQRSIGEALDNINSSIGTSLELRFPDAAEKLRAADDAYANYIRMEEAAARSAVRGGVFTPGDFLASVKKTEGGPRNGHFARGKGRMQKWGQDAQDVIGNKYPDSGTAGRKLLWEVASNPMAWAPLALGAAPYTNLGTKVLNKMAKGGTPLNLEPAARNSGRASSLGNITNSIYGPTGSENQ